ncbi:tRNA (uridine(54)-C5)-methyltransferase TrmA [Helicobacter enhydrae]|uniref:tRNA (Uridine(54)-C5)-methyltransferase TrmA n=1 Tax=Helicobacter enhydrae TaxID=222136 RepID=A0A1B1U669_9HELI|nr:tRNA (uridine(54)-C5)-methyltransferase TrmA [Helicobacter enhydrae]ANV98246.1 tRNA (uridine(54)-C5)-methyltransferase TrmA [Helicobacter enhydrae]
MNCSVFGECGGCSLPLSYADQLDCKLSAFEKLDLGAPQAVFQSPHKGYRARAEFKVYRDEHGLHFAMFAKQKPVIIADCPILLPHLQELLSKLKRLLNQDLAFASKLFAVEVLGVVGGGSLLTLIYHRKLDQEWEAQAKLLAQSLGTILIGRSRSQKVIISQETLLDLVSCQSGRYTFVRYDNSFSQPNPYMNAKMIDFALSCVGANAVDLLELYCGGGNFTLPLSARFRNVFATEVDRTAINALKQNLALNAIQNVFCARMSGEESIQALSFEREFVRLQEVCLRDYDFTHLLVDPPRSGIGDRRMLSFMGRFENIIYISCNPLTLKQDLEILETTHHIQTFVVFDQFPYTHHLECGVWLKKK